MTTITALPTPPSRAIPVEFSTRTDAFLGALPGFVTEANQIAADIAIAAAISNDAITAAAALELSIASIVNASAWVSGATYAIGATVWSAVTFQTFRRKTIGAGTTDPATDPTNWEPISSRRSIPRVARTANAQLVAADRGLFIDITSGTFSQTFAACSALGSDWSCLVGNSGSGDITLDPIGSETIDGLSTFVMYPGEMRLIWCTGSALVSKVINPFSRTFTTSGTFYKPPGYARFEGIAWSGGSSGQKNASEARGGGGGGAFPFSLRSADLAASETVVIGAGGAAVTVSAVGNVGGSTSLGSLVTVSGAAAGAPTTGGAHLDISVGSGPATHVPNGGLPSSTFAALPPYTGGGLYVIAVSTWWGGASASSDATSYSGNSVYGGAAGGFVSGGGTAFSGGTSIHGGDGGTGGNTTSGTDGQAPGGGGGGTKTGATSGAGARGELRIWGAV